MTTQRTSSAGTGRLTALYGRALLRQLPVVGAKGDTLPDAEVVEEGVEVERETLRAYDEVCGFRLSDAAPPTYLHVPAFRGAMELMTRRDFPFAIMGVVHIANRIEQRRAVRAGESVDLRLRAANLADHERGKQFDIVSEARAGGETIWIERSTYLRRQGGGGGGKDGKRDNEVPRTGAVWRVPGDAGRDYAGVSGDRNPIHLHSVSARLFGQPKPIAHGMWLKARCLAALEGRVPEACEIEVRFKLPVPLGSKVAFSSRPDGRGRAFELRSARDGRPHLTGRVQAS